MLFHVTMTHTADNCPGNSPEKLGELVAAAENTDRAAKELGVKVHFSVTGAPEHVSYSLLEADSHSALLGFLSAIPVRQDFRITLVDHEQKVLAMAKEMVSKMGRK